METSTTFFVTTERSGGDGHEMPLPITRYWTASLMFIAGSIGLIANVIVIRMITKISVLHNCFGFLLIFQAITGGGILIGFIFWVVPMTITKSEFSYSEFGYKIGQLMSFCQSSTLIVQIFKSINRFTAITFPFKYKNYSSKKSIIFSIIFMIIFSFLTIIIYFFNGCNLYYYGAYMAWVYDVNWCFNIMGIYFEFLVPVIIMSFVIIIDLLTLFMIFKTHALKNSKKEVKFFIQTFTVSFVYVISIVVIQICIRFPGNPVSNFFLITFNWELSHVIDGLLLLVFNFYLSKVVIITSWSKSKMNLTFVSKVEKSHKNLNQ